MLCAKASVGGTLLSNLLLDRTEPPENADTRTLRLDYLPTGFSRASTPAKKCQNIF